MRYTNLVLLAVVICQVGLFSTAYAAKELSKEKAEQNMVTACKGDKKFSEEVKDMSAQQIADWVETKEHGENASAFKKTKCYLLHEKWETAAGKNEEGEKHEHKE